MIATRNDNNDIFPTDTKSSAINQTENPAIEVDDVTMVFNIASENLTNLKEYFIALAKGELAFKEFKALQNVSFSVAKGDVFGILGTNGSGKSTMLKIIAGVLEPSCGQCTIRGNIAPLIELGAGFDMDLTARENVYLNGALLGYSKKFIAEHFDEIIEFAEVEDFLDIPLKNYSSGMVARIAFAIATVIVPDILIVDEVLSVGDFMFQQKCERRIQQLINDFGVTVLIVSHDTNQIERLCNRAIWIEKGITQILGPAEEVCDAYRALGGKTGSIEAMRQLREINQSDISVDSSSYDSLSFDGRFEAAAYFARERDSFNSNTAVVASGFNQHACLIATSLCSVVDAPLLLTLANRIPSATMDILQDIRPSNIILVGNDEEISNDIPQQIEELLESCTVTRISGSTTQELALRVYEYSKANHPSPYGDVAILSHVLCTGDLLCSAPFCFARHAPIFFSNEPDTLMHGVSSELLSGKYSEILLLGGEEQFSQDFVAQFEKLGLHVVRICGNGPFDACSILNDYFLQPRNHEPLFNARNPIVVSIQGIEDAYAVGPYAAMHESVILLQDARDLESLTFSVDFINNHAAEIKRLSFVGNETVFSNKDKTTMQKILLSAQEKVMQQS